MMNERRKYRLKASLVFLSLAVGITALDLWSKEAIFEYLEVKSIGEPPKVSSQSTKVIVADCFELEATYNEGAFYGMFGKHTGILTILSAAAVLVIVGIFAVSLRQKESPSLIFPTALGLICAGTLGNLYDRYYIGAVRDWIKWFVVWGNEEKVWPNFNVADSSICVGVGLVILLEIRNAFRERRSKKGKEVKPAAVSGPK